MNLSAKVKSRKNITGQLRPMKASKTSSQTTAAAILDAKESSNDLKRERFVLIWPKISEMLHAIAISGAINSNANGNCNCNCVVLPI